MKRAIGPVLFLLVIGMTAYACAEEAETFTSGGYTYTLNEDGSAVISKYSGWDKELTIPSKLDGHPVNGIGDEAFYYRQSLTSVTIPDSVTDLGANPWKSCENLTAISVSPEHPSLAVIDGALYSKADKRLVWVPMSTEGMFEIPQGIRIIGDWAFSDCESLTSVTIPDSVTAIDDWAFYRCESLTSVTIPDSVTSIGSGVFGYCESLTSVTVPDSVTSIGDGAFFDCENLTSVTIPDSVTSIGDRAFYGCAGLTSVTIPDSVTKLEANPWGFCYSLTTISVSPGHPALTVIDGALYSKADKRLIWVPMSTKGTFEIPQGVRIIGDEAFSYCYRLTSVTIPDSVTRIGGSAFSYCDSLTSVTIPDSVTAIGISAFFNCKKLTSVTIPDSVTSIGSSAFSFCAGLNSVTIPDSVTRIGNYAFFHCDSLSMVIVTEGSFAEQYCIDNNLPYRYTN